MSWVEKFANFQCYREVSFVHYPTAVCLWTMRMLALCYIGGSIYYEQRYFDPLTPSLHVTRPSESVRDTKNTFTTGANQMAGNPRVPLNITKPPYCFKPYVKNFVDPESRNGRFDHRVNGCAHIPESEIRTDEVPVKSYIMTYLEEKRIYVGICPDGKPPPNLPACNRTDAIVNVTRLPGANGSITAHCYCATLDGYYVVNPEGLGIAFLFSWVGTERGGRVVTGGMEGTGDNRDDHAHLNDANIPMTTVMMDDKGKVHYVWKDGNPATIKVEDLLNVAGVHLDRASDLRSKSDHIYSPARKAFEESIPNRLRGVQLSMEVSFTNYAKPDLAVSKFWNGMHEVVCQIRVRYHGAYGQWIWRNERTILDNVQEGKHGFLYPTIGDTYDTIGTSHGFYSRSYNAWRSGGIEIRYYSLPSQMGTFSFSLLVAQLLYGVVLLNVATEVTKYFACFAFQNDGEGTSQTFMNYQNTSVVVKRSVARTAAKAAISTTTFFASLDPKETGKMSRAKLFKTLQIAIGGKNVTADDGSDNVREERLTDAQVARVVQDVCMTANGEGSQEEGCEFDDVHLDEFCQLTSDDDTDVLDLIRMYRDLPGNDNFLDVLLNEVSNEAQEPGLAKDEKPVTPARDWTLGADPSETQEPLLVSKPLTPRIGTPVVDQLHAAERSPAPARRGLHDVLLSLNQSQLEGHARASNSAASRGAMQHGDSDLPSGVAVEMVRNPLSRSPPSPQGRKIIDLT